VLVRQSGLRRQKACSTVCPWFALNSCTRTVVVVTMVRTCTPLPMPVPTPTPSLSFCLIRPLPSSRHVQCTYTHIYDSHLHWRLCSMQFSAALYCLAPKMSSFVRARHTKRHSLDCGSCRSAFRNSLTRSLRLDPFSPLSLSLTQSRSFRSCLMLFF
jgi:hypothetical protein